jgi:hypothetical protein
MIVAATLMGAPLAVAQERPTSPQSSSPPNVDCHPPTTGPGQTQTDRGASGDNPTDKLAQSGGVLCPPTGVDPSMQKPAPDAGRTPVIPPPGSPGSNSPVQPK